MGPVGRRLAPGGWARSGLSTHARGSLLGPLCSAASSQVASVAGATRFVGSFGLFIVAPSGTHRGTPACLSCVAAWAWSGVSLWVMLPPDRLTQPDRPTPHGPRRNQWEIARPREPSCSTIKMASICRKSAFVFLRSLVNERKAARWPRTPVSWRGSEADEVLATSWPGPVVSDCTWAERSVVGFCGPLVARTCAHAHCSGVRCLRLFRCLRCLAAGIVRPPCHRRPTLGRPASRPLVLRAMLVK